MIAAADFNITKVETSKLNDLTLQDISFGKYFTDHMLEVDYKDGEWKVPNILPYQPLQLDPSLAALHYGQAIFEGIKAYKNQTGNPHIFRPYDNFRRFNLSAERMQMPAVPEEILVAPASEKIVFTKLSPLLPAPLLNPKISPLGAVKTNFKSPS